MAQLVERSLPIPEVRGSNPVIGKILYLYWTFVYCQLCFEKTKKKKKRPGVVHLKKKIIMFTSAWDLKITQFPVFTLGNKLLLATLRSPRFSKLCAIVAIHHPQLGSLEDRGKEDGRGGWVFGWPNLRTKSDWLATAFSKPRTDKLTSSWCYKTFLEEI